MTSEEIQLYKKIDEILWADWDPIGVNEFPEARDEYQGYLPQIFRLKLDNADKDTIAKHLDKISTEHMGLISNMQHCIEVAEKILIA